MIDKQTVRDEYMTRDVSYSVLIQIQDNSASRFANRKANDDVKQLIIDTELDLEVKCVIRNTNGIASQLYFSFD